MHHLHSPLATHSTPVTIRTAQCDPSDSLRSSSASSSFSQSETEQQRDAATPTATCKNNQFNSHHSKKTVFEATGTGTGLASPFWNRVFPWSNKSPIAEPAILLASTTTRAAADATTPQADKETTEHIQHIRPVRKVKSALASGKQELQPSQEDEQYEDEHGRRHQHDPVLSLTNDSTWARPRSRAQSLISPSGSRLPILASSSTSFAPAPAPHSARPPSAASTHTANGFGKGVDSLTSASSSNSSNSATSAFWSPTHDPSAAPTTPIFDTKRDHLFGYSTSPQDLPSNSAEDTFWIQHSSPLGLGSGQAVVHIDAHSPALFMKKHFFSPRSSPPLLAKSTRIPDTESDLVVPALAPAAEKLELNLNLSIQSEPQPQPSKPLQHIQERFQPPRNAQATMHPSSPSSRHASSQAPTSPPALNAYMAVSETGNLDMQAPDALLALPDVSTDFLESDFAALEMLASGIPLPESPISVQVVDASPRFRLDQPLVVSPLLRGGGSPPARRASEGIVSGVGSKEAPSVPGASAPRYTPVLLSQQQQLLQRHLHGEEEVLVSLQSPLNRGMSVMSSPQGASGKEGWMTPQVGFYRGVSAAPSAAMVELHSVFSSPGSVPRYSERDVQAIKRKMRLQVKFSFHIEGDRRRLANAKVGKLV